MSLVAEPGDRVPAYLFLPAAPTPGRRGPAMLALHQTTGIGKGEPAGLGGRPNLHYALELAQRGYVVLAPDYPSFGDYQYDFQYGGKIAGWASDRYMPRLRTVYGLDPNRVPFDFYEVVAALAPRAFFSNSPTKDGNFTHLGVKKAEAKAREVYALLGAPGQLQVRYPDCAHDFPPETRREAYAFIDRALGHAPTRQVP
jgi:hypothetical protein